MKILIFEDNLSLGGSLQTILSQSGEVEVLAIFETGEEAAKMVKIFKPDVVVMDIDMPRVNGIEAVREIKEERPQTSIVMYTQFEDDEKIFESLCAGANGYILKKSSPEKLLNYLKEVIDGGAPLSPEIARKVLQTFRNQQGSKQSLVKKYQLTRRENEILQLLTKGYSIKLISAELFIGFETVRTHLRNIYSKLHVNCGKEAIAKVLAEKII